MAFTIQRALVALAFSAGCLAASPAVARAQSDVAVVEVDPSTYTVGSWDARAAAAKSFFATHRDAYDFLVFFPAFPIDLNALSEAELLGLHLTVRNDVTGIGEPAYDAGALFGSGARLKGVIDIHSLVPGMVQDSGAAALATIAHEVGHQWSAGVSFRDPSTGAPSAKLRGADGIHWSYSLSSDASVMYGSRWTAQPNGSFVATESRKRYSPLDLYLMGILGADEVPPFTLIEPSQGALVPANGLPPTDGTTLSGIGRSISIGDVIAAEGARVPSAASSQKLFRAAFVILTPAGQAPSATQISFVDGVRREWVNQFFFMTRGRGLMETDLVELPPSNPASSPDLEAGLNWLLSAQSGDGSWCDDATTCTRETQVATEALGLFQGDGRVAPAMACAAAALASASPVDGDSWARTAIALRAAGAPWPPTLPVRPNPDGGVGLASGYGSTPLDSALVALSGAGDLDTNQRAELVDYLLATQSGDGGWPLLAGGPSSVQATSLAVLALMQEEWTYQIGFSIDAALVYFAAARQPDGLFTEPYGSPSDTAAALIAIDAVLRRESSGGGPDELSIRALLAMQLADGSWGESVHDTSMVLRALRTLSAPNLVIQPESLLAVPRRVAEGGPAVLVVSVSNLGRAASGRFSISVIDENGLPVSGTQTVDDLEGLGTVTRTFALDTTGRAGTQRVYVIVDPEGVIDETSEADNRAAAPFTIDPRPTAPDPYVLSGSVSTNPPSISALPTRLDVRAVVGNLGLSESVVQAAVLLGDRLVSTTELRLLPGETTLATFAVDVVEVGASLPVTVVVNPDGTAPDADPQNDRATHIVPVVHRLDLAVASVTVLPASLEQGAEVTITSEIKNAGTLTAQGGTVRFRIEDGAGGVVADLSPSDLSLAPGTAAVLTRRWRAGRSGTLSAVVEVRHSDDLSAPNDAGRAGFSVTPSTMANLRFASPPTIEPNPPLVGKPLSISASIVNEGGGDAGPFDADLRVGPPGAEGTVVGSLSSSGLAAGGTLTISGTFTPSEASTQAILATADVGNRVPEFDETDNVSVLSVEPLPIADLLLTDGDLLLTPANPKPGDEVTVEVSAYNQGGQASAPVAVELYLGEPAGGTKIGESTLSAVEPGTRAAATFTWATAGLAGPQDLVALVNGTRAVPERRYDNNRGTRRVVLQSGAVSVSEPYFSPNGDGVKDATIIAWRLAAPAPVQVRIEDPAGRVVRSVHVAASDVAFTWDGTTDGGGVARDFEYQVKVSAGEPGVQSPVGQASAVLDNNRLKISEAWDARRLRVTDLSADWWWSPHNRTDYEVVGMMPDERSILLTAGYTLYRQRLLGGPVEPIDIDWAPGRYDTIPHYVGWGQTGVYPANGNRFWDRSVSPDGTMIAVAGRSEAQWVGGNLYLGEPRVTLIDLASGTWRVLAAADPGEHPAFVQFSQDGKRVYFGSAAGADYGNAYYCQRTLAWGYNCDEASIARIYSVDLAGNRTLEAEHAEGGIRGFLLSPDGTRLAMTLYGGFTTVSLDGTRFEKDVTGFTPYDVRSRDVEWLSDGRHLAFREGVDVNSQNVSTRWALTVLNVDDGAVEYKSLPAEWANHPYPFAIEWDVVPEDDGMVVSGGGSELYGTANLGGTFGRMGQGLDTYVDPFLSPAGTSLVSGRVPERGDQLVSGRPRSFLNLDNLSAWLAASTPTGGESVEFRGFASDRYLAEWTISIRPYGSSATPVVVARSRESVMDGTLAHWVPPGFGLYQATLSVRDLAGNEASDRVFVAWNHGSPIANVMADPTLFSPNGDGRLDSTTIRYTVVTPTSTKIEVIAATGAAVRTVARIHAEPAAVEYVWDGLDDSGRRVPDGNYSVRIEGVSVAVGVDTTPPSAEAVAASWFPRDPDPLFTNKECPRFRVAVMSEYAVVEETGEIADVAVVRFPVAWRSYDANDGSTTLAVLGPSGDTRASYLGEEPCPCCKALEYPDTHGRTWGQKVFEGADMAGASAEPQAMDRAGNLAVGPPVGMKEELFLAAFGEEALLAPENGRLSRGGILGPRLDLLTPILGKLTVDDEGDETRLFKPLFPVVFRSSAWAFSVQGTVSQPIAYWAIEAGEGGTRDYANVLEVSPGLVVWDATSVKNGRGPYALVAVDGLGREHRVELPFEFIVDARVEACVGYHEPYGDVTKVTATFPVLDAPSDDALLTFKETGAISPALTVPLKPGGIGTSGYTVSVGMRGDLIEIVAAVDTWQLPVCEYVVEVNGHTTRGDLFRGAQEVNLCGIIRESMVIVNGETHVRLHETFREPIGSVDVFAGPGPRVASIPEFEGTMDVGLPGLACPTPFLWFDVARPGPAVTGFRQCPGFDAGCSRLDIRAEPDAHSPTCGQKEPHYTVKLDASVNAPPSLLAYQITPITRWGAEVGTIQSPLPPGQLSAHVAFDLSTRLLPEGVYQLKAAVARATDAPTGGKTFRGTSSTRRDLLVYVDRSPPAMGISSPAPGARMCLRRDPSGHLAFPVDLSISEELLVRYEVQVRRVGTEAWRGFLVLGHDWEFYMEPAHGPVRTWIPEETLSPGDYEMRTVAQDASRNSFCMEPRRFTVSDEAALVAAALTPEVVSPDGDGRDDFAEISADVKGSGLLTASARLPSGSLVELARSTVGEGSHTLRCSGSLPDGSYPVLVELGDECGGGARQELKLVVDTAPPVARLDSPVIGASLAGTVNVVGEASDANLADWELQIGDGRTPAIFDPVAAGTRSVTGILAAISTTGLSPGPHTLRLVARDRAGHVSEALVTLEILAGQIIAGLSAAPALVSPNGDGKVDEASATLDLLVPAVVDVTIVDGAGTSRPLVSGAALPAGQTAVPLTNAVLGALADGAAEVRVTASAGATVEAGSATVGIDRTPPAVTISSPLEAAILAQPPAITGSVRDRSGVEWSLSVDGSILASGTGVAEGALGGMGHLADGSHELRAEAVDAVWNRTETVVSFIVDTTAPVIAIEAPVEGEVCSERLGVSVLASITEANARQALVAVEVGGGSRAIFSGAVGPTGTIGAPWDVGSEVDGPATVSVEVEDAVGHRSRQSIQVVVDNTPPVARVDAPRDGLLGGLDVLGTGTDQNLRKWTLAMATGTPQTAEGYVEIASGSTPVVHGLLSSFAQRPPDGLYALKLTVEDRAGYVTEDEVTFVVDSLGPPPPLDLVATVEGANDVALSWSAVTDADTVSYALYRNGRRITTPPLTSTVFLDAAVPDGSWTYTVAAVDPAGNESARSNPAVVEIDTSLPLALITSPRDGDTVSGVVEVQGSAFSLSAFKEYRVSVGLGAAPVAWESVERSTLPVRSGALANLDTRPIADGGWVTIRLEAEDARGRVAEVRRSVVVDNVPPAAPVFVSAVGSGSSVQLTWRANVEPDLAGYVIFRDGSPLGAPAGASFEDLAEFLVAKPATSLGDLAVPDGVHSYHLVAMDRAGNVGPASNAISVTIETRPPSARIVTPLALSRTSLPARLVAESPDEDVATVRFEGRSRSDEPFVELETRGSFPYAMTLTPGVLAGPAFEVRAIATDALGNVDPAPPSTFFFVGDLPVAPVPRASVSGYDVSLAWDDANPPGSISGYVIRGAAQPIPPSAPRIVGTASASSSVAGAGPELAYDGAGTTYWSAAGPGPQRWQLDLEAPTLLSRIACNGGYYTVSATTRLKVRGLWVVLSEPTTEGVLVIDPPLEAEAVAFDFPASHPGTPGLSEVSLTPVPIIRDRAVVASGYGPSTYYVDAVTPLGSIATGSVFARIWRPALTVPPSPVRTSPARASIVAGPLEQISVLSSSIEVVSGVTDGAGNLAADVPLVAGANALTAVATDASGNVSAPSYVVTVDYAPLPTVSASLWLSGQQGSSATFSYTAEGDLAAVTSWTVLQDYWGYLYYAKTLAANARDFTMDGLSNGTYAFAVRPEFSDVNGAASNVVTVTMAAEPLPAPADLVVTAHPEGGYLALSWTYGGPVGQGFVVERADSVDGYFSQLNSWAPTTSTDYSDAEIVEGPTYFYRVRAVDEVGNLGDPSNVASGSLPDLVPPSPPLITMPTAPGAPATVASSPVSIGGVGEAYSTVEVYQDGSYIGSTTTDAAGAIQTPLALSAPLDGWVDVSSDGAMAAYGAWVDGDAAVVVDDFASGRSFVIPMMGGGLDGAPLLSPDGARFVVRAWGPPDYSYHLYVGELATGVLRRLVPGSTYEEKSPAWSRDSARVAYESVRDWRSALAIADVATGTERLLWSDAADEAKGPAWRSPTEIAAVIVPGTPGGAYGLSIFDAEAGSKVDIVTSAEWIGVPVAASASGARLALIARFPGMDTTVQILDSSGALLQSAADVGWSDAALSFSPDESRVAVVQSSSLGIVEPASAQLVWVDQVNAERAVWTTDGRIITCPRWDPPAVVTIGAPFQLDDVALHAGENLFFATTVDAGGNRSERSLPISVRLETGPQPDVAVSAAVSPTTLMIGTATTATVTARNVGSAASAATELEVRVQEAGGVRRYPAVSVRSLAPGESIVSIIPLDGSAVAGERTLVAAVDVLHVNPDANRGNDEARVTFRVVESDRPTLALSVEPGQVAAPWETTATASVTSFGPLEGAVVRFLITDGAGTAVASPFEVAVGAGSPGSTVEVTRALDFEGILAGSYDVTSELVLDDTTLDTAQVVVTVLPEIAASLRLAASRAEYGPAEPIELTSFVSNASRNAPLEGARLHVEVRDAAGAPVWIGAPETLSMIWLGGEVIREAAIPAGLLPAGAYGVHGVVELDGTTIAVAQTSFSIAAQPLLAGAIAVDAPGSPPAVKRGLPLPATATVRNVGTGPAPGVAARLAVVDAQGAIVASYEVDLGDLAPGASGGFAAAVPTEALPLGVYGLALTATHGGLTELLATARFRVADGLAPTLAILNLLEGTFVRESVTVRVQANDDATGVAAVTAAAAGIAGPLALESGNPVSGVWSGAVALPADGPHLLRVSARDAEGNDGALTPGPLNPISVTVVRDTVPPEVSVTGVAEGALVNHPVLPVVTATDLHLAGVETWLDGGQLSQGTSVTTDGGHLVRASAVDRAGNSANAALSFTIDRTPPSIAILGVGEGAYSASDLTPRVVVEDLHIEGYTATLDGMPFVEGAVLTEERTYQVAVEARDLAGNTSSSGLTFTIDKTAPVIQVAGVSEGEWFRGAASPDVTFTDANLLATEVTLDGVTFIPGTPVAAEGEHVLLARAVDRAGSRAEKTVRFFIDLSAPVIEIAGISDGDLVNHAVTPVVTVTDANLASSETRLDGVISLPGASVGGDGEHVVEVSASDLAGNHASARLAFEIDTAAPVIWASAQSGATYPAPLTVAFSAEDLHYGDVTATMDGQPFTSGEVVTAAGVHALVVTARDLAGNEAVERFEFTIGGDQDLLLAKELMGRSGSVLAWVSDGCRTHGIETDRVREFIRRSAPVGSFVHFAPDDSDFRAHLRTGEFGVYVVATLPGAGGRGRGDDEDDRHECGESGESGDDEHADDREHDDHDGRHDDRGGHQDDDTDREADDDRDDDGCDEEGRDREENGEHEHDCMPACRSLSRLTERELTEAVFRGAGLVVLKSGPNEVPALREASGVHVQGQEQEELVRLIESAFTQPGLLAIGGGVELELEGGAPVGWFGETGDEVAVSAHQFGLGEALVFGFDLAAALPPEVASDTFARAIGFAAGEAELLPAGVVGVRIRVENSGSVAGYRLVETVAPELQVARVLDGGQQSASGAIEWTGEVAASEPDSLRYFVRLPITPGAFDTRTQLFLTTGASERLVAETSLPLVLAGSRSSLEGSAEAAIGRLPTTGPDGAVRRQLASALEELKMNTGSSAEAREEAIETLLDAADLAKKLRTVDPTPLRVAIDRLLAYWEMKP